MALKINNPFAEVPVRVEGEAPPPPPPSSLLDHIAADVTTVLHQMGASGNLPDGLLMGIVADEVIRHVTRLHLQQAFPGG